MQIKINKRTKIFTLTGLILVLAIYLLFFDLYKVSSNSMANTINVSDKVLILKNNFLFTIKVKRNDIVVFQKPQLKCDGANYYIKRCVGIPNDTVKIDRDSKLFSNYKYRANASKVMYLYPQDSLFYKWNLEHYGPIWIPYKNSCIKLNNRNYKLYKRLIEMEGNSIEILDGNILVNGKISKYYQFKSDYYFMLGDNFYQSEDSRYWGPVPAKNINGKLLLKL